MDAAGVEAGIAALAEDRSHGAGYLARRALGIVAATPPAERKLVAERLSSLRPEMPAIAVALAEALAEGVGPTLRRADAERKETAAAAFAALAGRRVATISNSSLVAHALVGSRPAAVAVLVEDADDEGHLLVAELRATGLRADPTRRVAAGTEVGVCGCDALFVDGGFVNRRGTSRLAEDLAPRPLMVLAEHWKWVPERTPSRWYKPDRFEVISPQPHQLVLGGPPASR